MKTMKKKKSTKGIADFEGWFNGKSENKKLMLEFFDYCVYHQDQRFWQALRNWSGAEYIIFKKGDTESDTFYWDKKNEIKGRKAKKQNK
jgi:hypothetical protein